MISKLVDLVLKFAEMRFGARPVLVRDLKALHDALEDCHKKYLAIGAIPIDDEASRKASGAGAQKCNESPNEGA